MSELWDRYAALVDYSSGYSVPTIDQENLLYRVQQLRQKSRYKKQAAVSSMMPTPEKEWAPEKKEFVQAVGGGGPPGFKDIVQSFAGKGYDLFQRITSGEVSKDRTRDLLGTQIGRLLKESGAGPAMKGIKIADTYPEHAHLYPEGTTYGEVGTFADMARERGRLDVTETINFASGPGSAMAGQTLIDKGVDPKIALAVELGLGLLEPVPLLGKVGKGMTAGKGIGRLEMDIPKTVDAALNRAVSQQGTKFTLFELEEARRLMTEFAQISDEAGRLVKRPGEMPPGGPVIGPGPEKVSRGPLVEPGAVEPGGPIIKPGPELGRPQTEGPKQLHVSKIGEEAISRKLDIGGGRARMAKERQRLEAAEAGYKKQRGLRQTRAARISRRGPRREIQMPEEPFMKLVGEREAARTKAVKVTEQKKVLQTEQKAKVEAEEKVLFEKDLGYQKGEIARAETDFVRKLPKEGERFRARDLKVQAKPLRDRLEAFVEGRGTRGERGAMAEFQINQLPKVRKAIKKAGLNPDDYFPKSYLVKHIKKAGGRRTPDKFKDGIHQYAAKARLYFAPGAYYKGKMPGELSGPLEGTGLLKQLPTYTKGKGLSPEEMIEDLRASGYRLPEDASEFDLYAMIVEDYFHYKKTGRSRHYSSLSQDAVDDDIADMLKVYEAKELEAALEAPTKTEDLDRWLTLSKKEIADPKFIDELRPAMENLMMEQERIAKRLADPKLSDEEVAILKARNKKADRVLSRMEDAYDVDTDFPFGMNVGEGGGRSTYQKEVVLYHGQGGAEGGGAGGDFFSTNPERAASYGDEIVEVRVPRDVFKAGQRAARKAGSGTSGDVVLPDEWVRQAKPSQAKRAKLYDLVDPKSPTGKLDAEAKRLHDVTDPGPNLLDEKGMIASDLLASGSLHNLRRAFRVVYLGGIRSLDGALGSLAKSKVFDESVRLRMRKFQERIHSYEKYVETNSMEEIVKYRNTIKNLTDDEFDLVVDILNKKGGKALTTVENQKLRYAAQRIRAIFDRVADEAEPNGVLIGRKKAYWPHRFTKEQLGSDEFIKELAKHSNLSEADASAMVNLAVKNRKGARIMYNLERKRELFHPDFRRDRELPIEYIMEGYSRIGQAKYFSNKKIVKGKVVIPPGGENAVAELFINSMPDPSVKAIINMGFNQVINADISIFEPITRPLRWFNAISLLSTSAVAQAGQSTHLLAEAGLLRTVRGMKDMLADMDLKELARWQEWNGRMFSHAWRQDAKRALTMMMEPVKEPGFRSAALWQNIRQEVGRAAGKQTGFLWGLPTMDMYLRVLADRTGRRMLEAMVKAGDTEGLKLLGKEAGMDLTGVASGRGLLSSAEADTVGRYIANYTQFRTDPLHMPVGFNHELGRTIFQFFSFMRQHSRYIGRTLKELGNKDVTVRKRAAKRTARFLIMGAFIGEGISDVKAMLKGYDIEGADYSERSTWEKFERVLYTKRISWKDPVFRILQNYSILGGIGIFQMMLENCIRPGASAMKWFGVTAELGERALIRPFGELLTKGPGAATAMVTREAVARIPHFGYQIQREYLGTERQGLPAEGGWVGRLRDYWDPERQELRELTKVKEKGRREISALRRQRPEKEELEPTMAGRTQKVRGQISRQSRTKERERLLNLLQQAREQKNYRSYKAILRRAKRQGFRLTQE